MDGQLYRYRARPSFWIRDGHRRRHGQPPRKKGETPKKTCGRAGRKSPLGSRRMSTVLDAAPPQLLVPIALAMFSGLRKADLLSATLASLADGEIAVRTSKRGVPIKVPLHPTLLLAIAKRPNKPHKAEPLTNGQRRFKSALPHAARRGLKAASTLLGARLGPAWSGRGRLAPASRYTGSGIPLERACVSWSG